MKKHLPNSLRALFLSLAVLLSLPMLAEQVEIGGINYDLNADATQATVVSKSDKYSGDVVIPESVEHDGTVYSVTSIGNYAFEGCSGLTSVIIPNSVTSMGDCAFFNCSGLTSVTIGNGVASIGTSTFECCSGLTSVTIGNSVTSIGMRAFSNCSGLTSVTIPNSVMSIGNAAFYNCSGLTSVTIPNSVTSIGGEAFRDCSELSDVYCYTEEVPTTVSNAFYGSCPENHTLHVPAGSVESYKETAPWSDFKNIVALPPFSGEVEINGINYELNGETKQATVIKKSSGEYSGSIVIPESVEHESTVYSVTSIGEEAFEECSGLTSVTIPNSVTSIGEYAFFSCSGLTSVTIPNSVTSIGGGAFEDCSGLTSIVVEEGNTVYDSRNNCNAIIETASNSLICGCNTSIIPNGVTSIGEYAFYACSGLTSVTIPNSVTSIGDCAFQNCSGLTSVTIGNGVESIGSNAFQYCSGLTSVTIGNGVESIGKFAFYHCPELLNVYCYAENVPSTDSYAFDSRLIKNATLHVPAGSVDSYTANAPWKDFGTIVALPPFSGEVEIDGINYELNGETLQAAVMAKSSGKYSGEVVIPESVEHEGSAYSVTSIGKEAFEECDGLTSVTIPNSVTSIGEYAFFSCSGLTSVTIPYSVTSIGGGAFYGCSGLTSVTIPNSVMSIGICAFEKCSDLAEVTIGNGVKIIDTYAFYNCPELLDVYCYAEKLPNTEGDAFDVSYPEYATLHVPHRSIEDYKKVAPWSSFGTIKAISGTDLYFITYMLEGTEFHKDTLNVGATITPPQVSEKEGYTFDGWKNLPDTMPAKDIMAEGSYTANKYLLTFKIGDEVISTDSVAYGAKIEAPTAPEKEGHTFNGWADVPETMPANDVVVGGAYTVNKYLLTFKIGDEVISADSVEYGTKIETPVAPEKEGHTFSGWKDVPETMPAKDVVIVGPYSVNKYLLTFKIGDEVISADSVEYGAKIETPQAPEKEGHTFCGWKDVPETMPAKDIIISGSLLINTYKVTYMLNSQVFHTDSVKYGTKLPGAEVPVKEGHIFSGWMNVPEKMPAHDITIIGIFRLDSNNPQENGFLATSISDLRNNVAYTLSTPNHQRCEWPYKEVDYSLPRGKRVKIGTAQKELIPGKWYFLHNPRNPNQHASEFDQDGVIQYAGGFVTDQGIGSSLILSAKTIINDVSNSNGVLTDDYLPSMVRFVAVDSIEGAFNIQFGTGNWLALAEGDSGTRLQTITNDSHNAGLSGLYNFYLVTVNGEPNTAGRFGWNKYNMANRIDNNGGGNSVNFWSEGEIIAEELNSYIAEKGHESIKGNMIWQIYDIISLDEDYFDTDESDHGTPFSFVTPDSGNTYYMYHPVKKKFFNKNGLLTEEAVDPIYFEEGAYTWTLRAYFNDEHNINTNNEGEIVISDWKTADATNSFMFVVNNTFDTADLDNKLGIPHNYKITYMVDEEPYQVDTVLSGSKIIPIEEPTKEGHTFSGWQNVPDTMPIHDITIKGSFIINTYEVTFKIGDEVLSVDSVEYGAKIGTPQAPEKEGHTFNGWKDVPETMPANDVVIVGDYSVNKYLLTFKIGDEVIVADSVEYGAKIETPQAPEKEGHTFNGWKNVPETMPANDVVVVGSYSVNIYKVYYYVGDELVHTDEVAYGESIPAYEYTPTNGDKFMGWDGEQYDTMPAHDVTYIANIESGILYINGDMSEYQIYDLNGRKIENAKSLKNGVYIVNGKKTIVKVN